MFPQAWRLAQILCIHWCVIAQFKQPKTRTTSSQITVFVSQLQSEPSHICRSEGQTDHNFTIKVMAAALIWDPFASDAVAAAAGAPLLWRLEDVQQSGGGVPKPAVSIMRCDRLAWLGGWSQCVYAHAFCCLPAFAFDMNAAACTKPFAPKPDHKKGTSGCCSTWIQSRTTASSRAGETHGSARALGLPGAEAWRSNHCALRCQHLNLGSSRR